VSLGLYPTTILEKMNICAEAVFRRVFDRWQKPLQHYLQARGLELEAAADQVQNCFLKLWQNCKDVTEDKSKSYLFTTATRLQIDAYRKSKVRSEYSASVQLDKKEIKDGQYVLEEKEFKKHLEQCINSMSAKSREVFLLHRIDKMSYKSIAESLEISIKAVEKRMSKALAHLLSNKINLKR